MSLGTRIKEIRKKRSLSQKELAKLVNIHHTYLIRCEADKSIPSADKLAKLSEILQVTADYLLFGNGERKEPLINNPILFEKFRLLDKMDKEEQGIIIKLIDTVIIKNQMESVLKPHLSSKLKGKK